MITISLDVKRYVKIVCSQWGRFNSFRAVGFRASKQLTLNFLPGQLFRSTFVSMVFVYSLLFVTGETLTHVFVVTLATISVWFYSFLYQQLRQVSFFSPEENGKNILSGYC